MHGKKHGIHNNKSSRIVMIVVALKAGCAWILGILTSIAPPTMAMFWEGGVIYAASSGSV